MNFLWKSWEITASQAVSVNDRHPESLRDAKGCYLLPMGTVVSVWPVTVPPDFILSHTEGLFIFHTWFSMKASLLVCLSCARIVSEVMVFRCLHNIFRGCFYNLSWDKVGILAGGTTDGQLMGYSMNHAAQRELLMNINVLIKHPPPKQEKKTLIDENWTGQIECYNLSWPSAWPYSKQL